MTDLTKADAVRIFRQFIDSSLHELYSDVPIRFEHPLSVAAGDPNVLARDARSYLNPKQQKAYDAIAAAFGWWPANPSKIAAVAMQNATYVAYSTIRQMNGLCCCNYSESADHFLMDDIFKRHPYIIVSAPRGIGKTAFLNYWLTNRTEYLEEKENCTWFRIDVSKVHKLYKRGSYKKVRDAFVEYFRVHTLYVVSAYAGVFKGGLNAEINADRTSPVFRRAATAVLNSRNSHYKKFVHQFYLRSEEFIKSNGRIADISTDLIREFIVNDGHGQRSLLASGAMREIADELRRQKVDVSVMFDGIDNIAWTKGDQFYAETCKSFPDICDALRNQIGDRARFLLAARPETISEINLPDTGRLVGFNDRDQDTPFFQCTIGLPAIDVIVAKKVEAATVSDAFAKSRSTIWADDESKAYFLDYATTLGIKGGAARLPDAIERTIGVVWEAGGDVPAIDKERFIEVLFDNDTRAFLDNYLKVNATKWRFEDAGTIGAGDPERLVEYMLLNGRAFIDSRIELKGEARRNFEDRGGVFPNIFWYSTNITRARPHVWHGLAGLRVLQLARCVGKFVAGDLMWLLEANFDYHGDVLKEIVEAFVAYSLLDVCSNNRSDFALGSVVSQSQFSEYTNDLCITKKGRFLMDYIFLRPDILYFYCLDTPLLSTVVSGSSQFVRICREFGSLAAREDFYRAATITLAMFYCHVKTFHEIETKNLLERSDAQKELTRYFSTEKAVFRALNLPPFLDAAAERFVSVGVEDARGSAGKTIRADILSYLHRRRMR